MPRTYCVSCRPAGTLLCRVHTVLAVGGQMGHCYAGYILGHTVLAVGGQMGHCYAGYILFEM